MKILWITCPERDLMNVYGKAMGVLLAVNSQVAVIIWGAFWLSEELAERPGANVVIFVLAALASGHSYYVMVRYLFRLDKSLREKKSDQGGGGNNHG